MPTRHAGSEEERLALDIFIKLNRACAAVDRRVHAPLRELGLTNIQFGVLDVLTHQGPLPVNAIAEKNLCSQNSMCSVIDTMERNRLVRRERCSQDRRVVHVMLTDEGKELYARAWPPHLDRIVEASRHLTHDEKRQLDALLRKLGRGDSEA